MRPKNKSIRKCKKWHCATGVHGHCIADWFRQVPTSSDKSEQLWSAIFSQPWDARCPNLAHPQTCVQFSNRTSLETLRPSQVVETPFRHASIGVRCELVWSATFLGSTSKSDISSESSRLAEFEWSRAFQSPTACPSAAKKICGSHRFGVGPGQADKMALVQELSKAITFLSEFLSWWNFTFELSYARAF